LCLRPGGIPTEVGIQEVFNNTLDTGFRGMTSATLEKESLN